MGIGRVLCVALPFILTAVSVICLLIAGLSGVTNKDLYLFRVNTTELQFNPNDLDINNLISGNDGIFGRNVANGIEWHDKRLLDERADNNVTAADLGLANLYDISLWGYCTTDSDGDRTCSNPRFDWANSILNDTIAQFKEAAALADQDIALPDAIEEAMNAFAVVTKWTEVVYIASLVALGIELFFGIFATCSRIWSCVTFLFAAIASLLVIAAASLSTAMAVVVVGTVEASARFYGVRSNFNNTFLAFSWLAAAFALGAGFFWMFTVCCCASNHTSRRGFKARSTGDREKGMGHGGYQPLGDQHEKAPFYSAGAGYASKRLSVGPRSDVAYEPYSHSGHA